MRQRLTLLFHRRAGFFFFLFSLCSWLPCLSFIHFPKNSISTTKYATAQLRGTLADTDSSDADWPVWKTASLWKMQTPQPSATCILHQNSAFPGPVCWDKQLVAVLTASFWEQLLRNSGSNGHRLHSFIVSKVGKMRVGNKSCNEDSSPFGLWDGFNLLLCCKKLLKTLEKDY